MSWRPDADGFVRDLEAKPSALRGLADVIAQDPWEAVRGERQRFVFLGMGSSRFAAMPIAARLRARGHDAVAEYASATFAHPGGRGTLAIGISASGTTPETVEALTRYRDAGSRTVAVTNASWSPLDEVAGLRVPMHAGPESGAVACRTFQHTLALGLSLVDPTATVGLVRRAADATADLLDRREEWLPGAAELVAATGRAFLLAPDARSSSAAQGALVLREGPRLHADACESADWLHVDVYLTKTQDYRALLFAGSPQDGAVMTWMRDRDARVIAVGRNVPGAEAAIRYPFEEDDTVALLTEVVVAELVAAEVWRAQA